MAKKPKAEASKISAELVRMAKRARFNPIASLNPELLAQHLDSFAVGHLSSFALDAQAIKRRDDVISVALPKREKAVSRLGYAVHLNDGLDLSDATLKTRAEAHQAALKFFYDNLSVTNALDRNERGGMRLLVRQMMEAVGFKYAAHEVVYEYRTIDGRQWLTAKLTYAPLQFFENTTGQLRFLKSFYGQIEGEEMQDDGWLVTVGEGIMEPLAVAWMFKQLSLKDWVSFNELLGTPIRLGKTNAAKDSDAWNVLVEALEAIGQDFAAVVNEGSAIEFIEVAKTGATTFAPLVERMDRAIATICRGADLSTMSKDGAAVGATSQDGESDLLCADDAEMITETLLHLSRIVIRELFGPDETPLARVCVAPPQKKDAAQVRENLKTAVTYGLPVGQQFARDALGVPAPAEGEPVLTAPVPAAPGPFASPTAAALANAAEAALNDAQFEAGARKKILAAKAAAFAPLVARIKELIDMDEGPARDAAAIKLKDDLPRFAKSAGVTDAEIEAWAQSMAAKLVSGAAEAAKQRAAQARKT